MLPSDFEDYGQAQESTQPCRVVRPYSSEEGIFILEAGKRQSTISLGWAHIGGAVIRYTYERPQNIKDPVPLLLVPGYGGIRPAYKELRQAVVDRGKPAVTFSSPRSQKQFAALHPKHFLHPERLLAQSVIAITSDLIKNDGTHNEFEQLDTAGHSMGGPAIVNAGLVHPEQFRSVTAIASSGLDGHTLVDMGKRGPAVFKSEIIDSIRDVHVDKDYRAAGHITHYIARNPWRTAAEGLAVGSGDIRDKVSLLGSLGVRTAALQFANDHLFPLEGVREHSGDRFDLFRVFPDLNANHMWPQLQPEAVALELVDIVETLQSQTPASS